MLGKKNRGEYFIIQQEHFEMEKYMFTFNFRPFKMIS